MLISVCPDIRRKHPSAMSDFRELAIDCFIPPEGAIVENVCAFAFDLSRSTFSDSRL